MTNVTGSEAAGGRMTHSQVHSSRPVLQLCSVPLGLLLHHGSAEDMFEQLTPGHESGQCSGRGPFRDGISQTIHQASQETPLTSEMESAFQNDCRVTWF